MTVKNYPLYDGSSIYKNLLINQRLSKVPINASILANQSKTDYVSLVDRPTHVSPPPSHSGGNLVLHPVFVQETTALVMVLRTLVHNQNLFKNVRLVFLLFCISVLYWLRLGGFVVLMATCVQPFLKLAGDMLQWGND